MAELGCPGGVCRSSAASAADSRLGIKCCLVLCCFGRKSEKHEKELQVVKRNRRRHRRFSSTACEKAIHDQKPLQFLEQSHFCWPGLRAAERIRPSFSHGPLKGQRVETLAADLDTGKVSVQDLVLNVHPSGGSHYSCILRGDSER